MNPHNPQTKIPLEELRELDAICDQFELAWKNKQRPKIVEFVADRGEPGRSELLRQLLEVEFEQRLSRGESPQPSEYQPQFPSLSEWIQQRLDQLCATPDTTADDTRSESSQSTGKAFGKFVVVDQLGEGGMGTVYRARHSMIECERALKLLRPHLASRPEAVKRFLMEAQACVEMSHPNIVTTYHVDQETSGDIYLVMELLDGENLDQLVRRCGPLEYKLAATIIRQAAAGLDYAHSRGAVHRDIKPHNIMWTRDGAAKILDLGLVHILEEPPSRNTAGKTAPSEASPTKSEAFNLLVTRFQSRLTNSQALVGTLPYMSPEQADDPRSADKQSDVYSLGCTFYFLLTGRHAFVGETVEEVVRKHLDADFEPVQQFRPDIPAALSGILTRMMSRDRRRRFKSAKAVEQALRQWEEQAFGKRPAQPILSEPVDLANVDELRQALLRLRIVSENDWETAQIAASRIRQGDKTADQQDAAAPILQKLQALQNERSGQKYGLSEFQVRHILNGRLDLLRLPHHVLLDQVGGGWKGEVFKARNLEADRVEVIRSFSPRVLEGLEGEGRERTPFFRQQVEKLAALEHSALARAYDSGEYENRVHGEMVYLASQFIYGPSLAHLVLQSSAQNLSGSSHQAIYGESSADPALGDQTPGGRPLNEVWAVSKIRDVCRVLELAHTAGLLHLDVHAGAIKVDGSDQVKLLDLGVAAMLTRRPCEQFAARAMSKQRRGRAPAPAAAAEALHLTATGRIEPPPVGTAHIMPPEQWRSRQQVSPATDIYNVGCTLFFVLAGQYPFEGVGALELMEQHLNKPPMETPQAKRIPKKLRGVLEKALAKSPQQRYRSAGEMADALDEYLASAPPASDPSSENQQTKGWFSRLTSWSKR